MKAGDRIRTFTDLSGDLSSPNTVLVAALVTLGIPLDEDIGVQSFMDGSKAVVVWTLKEQSLCGKYATPEMMKAWADPDWIAAHPEHPLTYLKKGFENRQRMVDHIKEGSPIVMKRRGKKIGLVTRHTTDAHRRKIVEGLNSAR